jgi:putrescine transport system ATP-binding protein
MVGPSQPAGNQKPWLDETAVPQIVIDDVCKSFDGFAAVQSVSLNIHKGEMFALVGGSGCGKTTLLRMLAGFVEPDTGSVIIDGANMAGVPPHDRPVNMMFQSYALFPHMSVGANVGYGLRRLRLNRGEALQRTNAALDMVQLGGLGARKPHQLSGGQRQRVALARALIRRPKVLLLDEPLSALDKKLREQTQFELINIQYQLGITFIIVTHDQEEAMALSTRMAVMDKGRVVQVGTPAEIYEFPKTRFVAGFIGNTNLFDGKVIAARPGEVTVCCVETGCHLVVSGNSELALGQLVCVALRPEKIKLSREATDSQRFNQVRGVVWELGYLGNHSNYRIKTDSGKIISVMAQNDRRTADWTIDWNNEIYASWSADAAILLYG